MKRRFGFAALVLALLTGYATAAPATRPGQPRTIPTEPKKSYVHAPSRFEFPFNIGAFRRASVVAFDDAGRNIAVGYGDPALKIIVTLYVYPNHGVAAADHFKQVKQDVQRANPTAKLVDEKPVTLEPPARQGPSHEGLFARYNMRGPLAGVEQDLFSEAYVFSHQSHFLKLRLTYPSADAKAAQTRVEGFLNALVFPEPAANPKP